MDLRARVVLVLRVQGVDSQLALEAAAQLALEADSQLDLGAGSQLVRAVDDQRDRVADFLLVLVVAALPDQAEVPTSGIVQIQPANKRVPGNGVRLMTFSVDF